jgi:hypothetical protein
MQPWATLNPFWVSNKAFLRKSPFLFFGVKWVLTPGRVVPTADLPSGSSAWCRRSYSCRISGRPVSSPGTAIACSPDPGISYSEPTPHGICLDPCGGSLLSVGPGNRWSYALCPQTRVPKRAVKITTSWAAWISQAQAKLRVSIMDFARSQPRNPARNTPGIPPGVP